MNPDDGLVKDRGRIQVISPLLLLYMLFIIQKNHLVLEIYVLKFSCICENIDYLSIYYGLLNVSRGFH